MDLRPEATEVTNAVESRVLELALVYCTWAVFISWKCNQIDLLLLNIIYMVIILCNWNYFEKDGANSAWLDVLLPICEACFCLVMRLPAGLWQWNYTVITQVFRRSNLFLVPWFWDSSLRVSLKVSGFRWSFPTGNRDMLPLKIGPIQICMRKKKTNQT